MRLTVCPAAPAAVLVVLGLALSACAGGEAPAGAVGEPRPGLRLTGTVGGRQVAVADSRPDLLLGGCGRPDGLGEDVCFVSRDLTGEPVVLVFVNPAVLAEGARLDVGAGGCADPAACEEVTGVAVLDLRVGATPARRASGGTLRLAAVQPGARYAGTVLLRFGDGQVSGEFDVTPRPQD
jgi:hypothetical protein